jgi:hypothetical protein
LAGITDWLTAVGTVGAFGVALYLLSVQMRDRHDEHVRGQARLVAAWIDEIREELQEDTQQSIFWKANVVVQNDSNEPVYHVVVRLPVGVRGTFVRGLGVIGPREGRELSFLIPGFLKSELAPDVLFFDKAGVTWIRNGQTGKLSRVKIDDIIEFKREDAGAYPSIEAHPTLGIVDNIRIRGK